MDGIAHQMHGQGAVRIAHLQASTILNKDADATCMTSFRRIVDGMTPAKGPPVVHSIAVYRI